MIMMSKKVSTIVLLFFTQLLVHIYPKTLIGDFQFLNEFDSNLGKKENFEKEIGSSFKFSVVTFFTGICPAVSADYHWFTDAVVRTNLNAIWNSGSVPMMTWQPACYQPDLPSQSNISSSIKTKDTFVKDIGNGEHDGYLNIMAAELKLFLSGPDGIYGNNDDRRIFIRLGHEMNGNWYPWSVAYNKYITTEDYKSMWIRTRKVFDILNSTSIKNVETAVDVSTRIQWIWNANNFDSGAYTAEEYYPGDEYVDSLGLDVYNPLNTCFGGQAPEAYYLMIPMIERLQALSLLKPITVPEFGCEFLYESGVEFLGRWYQDFFKTAHKYGLSMLTQFNFGPNAVYGSTTQPEIPMYIEIIQNSSTWLVSSSLSNTRLISDEDFIGTASNVVINTTPLRMSSGNEITFRRNREVTSAVATVNPSQEPTYAPSQQEVICTYIPPTFMPTFSPTRRPTSMSTSEDSTGSNNKSKSSNSSVDSTVIAVAVGVSIFSVLLIIALLYNYRSKIFPTKAGKDERHQRLQDEIFYDLAEMESSRDTYVHKPR